MTDSTNRVGKSKSYTVGDPVLVIPFREFIKGYQCMDALNYTF